MEKFRDLPQDVVEEIMSRLEPESLLKLKRVGKSWYSLIDGLIRDQNFVHKNMLSNKTRHLLFDRREDIFIRIFDDEDNNKYNAFVGDVMEDLKPLVGQWLKDAILVGYHCNGLLCFVNFNEDNMLLCNPITKRVKYLQRKAPSSASYKLSIVVGLGYDRFANVYKVVSIYEEMNKPSVAMVHTLGDDESAWREIDMHIKTLFYIYPFDKGMYSSGVYYWLAWVAEEEEKYVEAVVSFDVHDEAFRSVAFLPERFKRSLSVDYQRRVLYDESRRMLIQWNDSVALLLNLLPINCVQIWVLNKPLDHHHSPTWTKHQSFHFKVPRHLTFYELVLFDSNHFLLCGSFSVMLYNMLTGEFTEHYKVNAHFFRAFGFVPSLVSLGAPN